MLIEVGSKFGVNFRLYIKHEGVNPTGTHKDRIAKLHIAKARFLNFKKVVAASCGNFGASLAYFAKLFGLEVTIFIPESFESPRVKEIEHLGASLKRIRATYEECVLESSEYAKKEVYYDANP
ncbi:MAG: pyridoxal-phosphate dependent enzyme, partial [Deltaproteobacteria bacterium]|nr:pyridoxal-phosphate dependent enzyme [Deltaproteobacteria bacterium]